MLRYLFLICCFIAFFAGFASNIKPIYITEKCNYKSVKQTTACIQQAIGAKKKGVES